MHVHVAHLPRTRLPNAEDSQEAQVRSLGQEDPLEEGMTTHSSFLAWRIPWTEEPGGLQSMGSQRVRHDWGDLARHARLTAQRRDPGSPPATQRGPGHSSEDGRASRGAPERWQLEHWGLTGVSLKSWTSSLPSHRWARRRIAGSCLKGWRRGCCCPPGRRGASWDDPPEPGKNQSNSHASRLHSPGGWN